MKLDVFFLIFCVFHTLYSSDTKKQVFLRITPSRSQFLKYEHVSLSCDVTAGGSRLWRNTTTRGIESCPNGWGKRNGSTCTITTIYPSDSGLYWCESNAGERSQTVHIRVTAALRVVPNRSQFFRYESVTVSCGQQGNSSEWRVKRNTSTNINRECPNSGNGINGSHCFIDDLYPSDTGVYWCESAAGECSDAVIITVTGGSVILESPVHPVMEGDDVTLHCTNGETSSSNVTTDFYKDGSVIRTGSTGHMTVHSVSKSDEGLYTCHISGAGQSPDSWLTVTLRVSDPASDVSDELYEHEEMSVFTLICHIVVGAPYLLSTIILGLIYRDKRRVLRLAAVDRRHNVIMEVE